MIKRKQRTLYSSYKENSTLDTNFQNTDNIDIILDDNGKFTKIFMFENYV